MLELSAEDAVPISIVAQPGIWVELAERLAGLHFERELSLSRLVVILPLVEGAGDRARELLAAGAPFDPGAWEIQEQQVFATDSEVVFVIEIDDEGVLERLADNSMPWVAAPEWAEIVAGQLTLCRPSAPGRDRRTRRVAFLLSRLPGPAIARAGMCSPREPECIAPLPGRKP